MIRPNRARFSKGAPLLLNTFAQSRCNLTNELIREIPTIALKFAKCRVFQSQPNRGRYWIVHGETRHVENFEATLKFGGSNNFAILQCNLTNVFEGGAPLHDRSLLDCIKPGATFQEFKGDS